MTDLSDLLIYSKALWNETNIVSLLNQLHFILTDRLKIGVCEVITYQSEPEATLKPAREIEGQTVAQSQGLSAEDLMLLKTELQEAYPKPSGKEDCPSDIHRLQASGKTVCYAPFRFIKGQITLLAWQEQADAKSTMPEYLVMQFLSECRWLKRLDHAESMVYRDDLTGLFNYRYLEIALKSEVRRAERFRLDFSVVFVDLDRFKQVNDTRGHLVGSSALKQLADVFRRELREVDSIIRYGGDEYVLLLLGANREHGFTVSERLRQAIALHPFQGEQGEVFHLTASLGLASFPEDTQSQKDLLKLADQAMYLSKEQGRNRVSRACDVKDKEPTQPAPTQST